MYVSHVLFQIAYLENLLKVYNEEIRRLQERDLSVDDLEKEDSSYIQEHKLKRKVSLFIPDLVQLHRKFRKSLSTFFSINSHIWTNFWMLQYVVILNQTI